MLTRRHTHSPTQLTEPSGPSPASPSCSVGQGGSSASRAVLQERGGSFPASPELFCGSRVGHPCLPELFSAGAGGGSETTVATRSPAPPLGPQSRTPTWAHPVPGAGPCRALVLAPAALAASSLVKAFPFPCGPGPQKQGVRNKEADSAWAGGD